MTRAHARADPDHLGVPVLVRHDLVEQRQHRLVAAVHDREAADLDHVEIGQDGAHRRLGPGDHLLVHERLAHEAGDHVLRTGGGTALKMTVPTGWPSSAAVSWPGLSPLTNWISLMCRALSISSSTARSTIRSLRSRASSSCTLMRGIWVARGS